MSAGFPYTDKQQRWWWATHPDVEKAHDRMASGDVSNDAIVGYLKATKVARADEFTVTSGWEPVATKPWSARVGGKVLRRFSSAQEMQAFLSNEDAVRKAAKAAGVL